MVTLYGIPNCDTVKKAMTWLKENSVTFQFHDFKKEGIRKEKIKEWIAEIPVDKLLNKKSTVWRALSEADQNLAESNAGALQLMAAHTNLIKRPVAEISGTILSGFSEDAYIKAFKNS